MYRWVPFYPNTINPNSQFIETNHGENFFSFPCHANMWFEIHQKKIGRFSLGVVWAGSLCIFHWTKRTKCFASSLLWFEGCFRDLVTSQKGHSVCSSITKNSGHAAFPPQHRDKPKSSSLSVFTTRCFQLFWYLFRLLFTSPSCEMKRETRRASKCDLVSERGCAFKLVLCMYPHDWGGNTIGVSLL